MSYDVYLHVNTGADHYVTAFDRNMTSNVAPMWREAGVDIAELHGKKSADCVAVLSAAVLAMQIDPAKFRAMDPPNGWGSYESCLDFLTSIRDACRNHPACEVSVSH